jgi:ABC-type histidine transport system ATPase subunit
LDLGPVRVELLCWPPSSTLFGQFVGMAGYYHLDDPQHVLGSNATYRYVHTPLSRATQYNATRVMLLDNTADQSDPTFAGDVYRMRDTLAAAGHRPGAMVTARTHSWAWANSVLPLAVRFLSQAGAGRRSTSGGMGNRSRSPLARGRAPTWTTSRQ